LSLHRRYIKAIDLRKKKRKDGNVEGGNTNEKRDEESKRKGSAAGVRKV